MSGLQITEAGGWLSHMRSQVSDKGNNANGIAEFHPNSTMTIMLFWGSHAYLRASIVFCVNLCIRRTAHVR